LDTTTWDLFDPVALGGPARRVTPVVLPASVREANEPQTDLAL